MAVSPTVFQNDTFLLGIYLQPGLGWGGFSYQTQVCPHASHLQRQTFGNKYITVHYVKRNPFQF